MTKPLFVTYYTDKYRDYYVDLERSAVKHGIDLSAAHIEDDATLWVDRACHKSRVVYAAMEQYNRPVVWIDCDARFNWYPKYFDDAADHVDYAIGRLDGYHDCGNVMLFNNTMAGRKVIALWNAYMLKYRFVHDEAILSYVWHAMNWELVSDFIPKSVSTYTLSGSPITQMTASLGQRSKIEVGVKDFTPEFRRALVKRDFSAKFKFETIFKEGLLDERKRQYLEHGKPLAS